MKKMTKSLFVKRRNFSEAMFCRVLKDQRNFRPDLAAKVAKVLGTDTHIWREEGHLAERSEAWNSYVVKANTKRKQ